MIASLLALAAFVGQVPQESKLKDAWPKLVEAWKQIDTCSPAPGDTLPDEYLSAMAAIHAAFEAAGMKGEPADYETGALKQLFKHHTNRITFTPAATGDPRAMVLTWAVRRGAGIPPPLTLNGLLASLKKLGELKAKGLDDEDNVQDEMAEVRKGFKVIGFTSDDTPQWLRRRFLALSRALVMGEAYPEPAKATDEQAKQIKTLLADLGSEDLAARENATRDLLKLGEEARSQLHEAVKSPDAEVAGRAKKILGMGHEPWKKAPEAAPKGQFLETYEVVPLER